VGDASVLIKDRYWRALLTSYSERRLLVEDESERGAEDFTLNEAPLE
jgi:hypothetical protein